MHLNPCRSPSFCRQRSALALYCAVWLLSAAAIGDATATPPTASVAPGAAPAFTPPPPSAIPAGPDGDAIRRGLAIFLDPARHAGNHVGSALTCANCHLDAGRQAGAAPMWAAWGVYPKYRSKDHAINTMEDRIRDCFVYSMNAPGSPSRQPPPRGSAIYTDLQIYFHWLATNAPTGQVLAGAGFPPLAPTALGFDAVRGKQVYANVCAACHGADGLGLAGSGGKMTFPPLWGAHSYNGGAGMARIATAAAFVKANMPPGAGGTLTDQQAWDVAAYINAQPHPRDPRLSGASAPAANTRGH